MSRAEEDAKAYSKSGNAKVASETHIAGAKALLEWARSQKQLTDIGGPDDVCVIEYVPLIDLEAYFAEGEK